MRQQKIDTLTFMCMKKKSYDLDLLSTAAKSNHNEHMDRESKGEMLALETLVELQRMFPHKGMSCGRMSRGQECSVKRCFCAPSFGGKRQMSRGFWKGLSESQSRGFVLASLSMAWKDYSPLRRKLRSLGAGGCHFLT